ncbi:hypothetical protein [Chamaesiphon sp. OTE_8_metabat_110]|uniref:hypothetical protein n=1 Tax=Chamaesiphon sp. OTE_8_metabat_110 TaxID=2964696 RepID=UPI00286B5626|nr:hypothetical protein [Chamaesiphon sp. OTE_8_metabat_110]
MEQFFYYRSLSNRPVIWRDGKKVKSFPSNLTKDDYLRHMKLGKGFPSIWKSSSDEDLERIALGTMLCRGHLDKLELIGFDPCCFEQTKIRVVQATDPQFPLPLVANLHHELCVGDSDDNDLIGSIEIFLQCNGDIKRFPKLPTTGLELSILDLANKYIEEISGDNHLKTAHKWIEDHEKKLKSQQK